MQGSRSGPGLDEPSIKDISGTNGEMCICPSCYIKFHWHGKMAIINKQKKSVLQNSTYSIIIFWQKHTHRKRPGRIFGAFIILMICVF